MFLMDEEGEFEVEENGICKVQIIERSHLPPDFQRADNFTLALQQLREHPRNHRAVVNIVEGPGVTSQGSQPAEPQPCSYILVSAANYKVVIF